MSCVRCQADAANGRTWCGDCERAFDGWSRRFAGDIVWSVLAGMVVVVIVAMGVPLLGASAVWATPGIVGGAGAMFGVQRWNRRRRRTQFLLGAAVPRAYLPSGRTQLPERDSAGSIEP